MVAFSSFNISLSELMKFCDLDSILSLLRFLTPDRIRSKDDLLQEVRIYSPPPPRKSL